MDFGGSVLLVRSVAFACARLLTVDVTHCLRYTHTFDMSCTAGPADAYHGEPSCTDMSTGKVDPAKTRVLPLPGD